jgi:hypothetical protein
VCYQIARRDKTYSIADGSVTWDGDAKGENDVCGDVNVPGGGGDMDVDLYKQLEITCADINSDGYLDFSICFSWRTDGTDDECDPMALYPGTVAKCDCLTIDVPQITVTKETTHSTCI